MTVRDKTISERQLRDVQELVDNTGGTTDGTLAAATDTTATDQSAVINNNFAEINAKLDALLDGLKY